MHAILTHFPPVSHTTEDGRSELPKRLVYSKTLVGELCWLHPVKMIPSWTSFFYVLLYINSCSEYPLLPLPHTFSTHTYSFHMDPLIWVNAFTCTNSKSNPGYNLSLTMATGRVEPGYESKLKMAERGPSWWSTRQIEVLLTKQADKSIQWCTARLLHDHIMTKTPSCQTSSAIFTLLHMRAIIAVMWTKTDGNWVQSGSNLVLVHSGSTYVVAWPCEKGNIFVYLKLFHESRPSLIIHLLHGAASCVQFVRKHTRVPTCDVVTEGIMDEHVLVLSWKRGNRQNYTGVRCQRWGGLSYNTHMKVTRPFDGQQTHPCICNMYVMGIYPSSE